MAGKQSGSSNRNSTGAARKRGRLAGKTTARTHGFYSGRFTADELALVAAFTSDPSLDDEIWMQRVLNRRLLQYTEGKDAAGEPLPIAELVKVAEALATGTGRVARLLRDRRVLSGESADSVTDAIAAALDEVGEMFGVKL